MFAGYVRAANGNCFTSMLVLRGLGSLCTTIQKDMSRTEELSVQLRTLSYDHERMTSFNRTSSQRADNLERELNAQKAREACVFML